MCVRCVFVTISNCSGTIFLQPLSLVFGILMSSHEGNSWLVALGLGITRTWLTQLRMTELPGWWEGKTFLGNPVTLFFSFATSNVMIPSFPLSFISLLTALWFSSSFSFVCSFLHLSSLAGGHLVCGEVRRPVTSQNILYFSTPFLLSHFLLHFWQQRSFPVWKPPSLLSWWGQH